MNLRDLTFFILNLFCIGINWECYKQFGGRYRLVLMSILVVCCVWNIMEVAIK